MSQYVQAIQQLNARLGPEVECAELAILGSLMFINIEFLLGQESKDVDVSPLSLISSHLKGAHAVFRAIAQHSAHLLSRVDLWELGSALHEVQSQVDFFSLL